MAYDYRKGLSGAFRGSGEAASRYLSAYLLPGIQGADERLAQRQGAYDRALGDPTGQADLFSKYFQTAANAYAQPALHDFNNQLAGVQANTARRFGGNASSAELKNVYNTSDLFSRNLTNAIAGFAPQAAGMGLDYTRMLGQSANEAYGQRSDLTNQILSGIGMYGAPQQKKGGNVFGALTGAALGYLKGGPAGALAGGYQGYGR